MKPEDIVLTRRDKFFILLHCLDDILPWQIPAFVSAFALMSHVVMLNNAHWYADLDSFRTILRVLICVGMGLVEGIVSMAIIIPISDKITEKWPTEESIYRKRAVRKVEELLLAQKRDDDEAY